MKSKKIIALGLASFVFGILSPFALMPLEKYNTNHYADFLMTGTASGEDTVVTSTTASTSGSASASGTASGASSSTTTSSADDLDKKSQSIVDEARKKTEADKKRDGDKLSGKICNNAYGIESSFGKGTSELEQAAESHISQLNFEYKNQIKEAAGTCGEANGASKYLEKGDCAKGGQIVTELSEAIGRTVSLGGGDSKNKVINVYKGACCMVVESEKSESAGGANKLSCAEKRDVYFKNISDCTENADHCAKKQWIIGQNGMGVLQIYIKLIYNWGAGIVGFIAVVVIVISGIQISFSGVSGDMTEAKDRILHSIMGIVLLFLSGIILYIVNPDFFG